MRRALIGLTILALVAGTGLTLAQRGDYSVDVILPSATNVNEGSPVLIDGFSAGTVERIAAEDGKARITIDLDDKRAPLHDGARVTVKWRALVGERYIELHDGSDDNAEVPSGGMLKGDMPAPMEVDQILAALDEPTRNRLKSLVGKLDSTTKGSEKDLQATLSSAGPAIGALGEVLNGLGTDGEAIGQLVTQLDSMVGTLASGDEKVRRIVQKLSALASSAAGERGQLAKALKKLPGTIDRATGTLGSVPGVVDKTNPLLADLQPATAKLPEVARNLKPVLQDLRPLAARLRPTLSAADELLDHTPGLLDSAHSVVPDLGKTVAGLREPLHFLRPYTPEAAGALTNWASAVGNYSGTGHYARFNVSFGAHSVGGNPGVVPPGYHKDEGRAPGALVGQPWTDAYGSGVR